MAAINKSKSNKTILRITECMNKKGEIKGKSKKETKELRARCMHHRYTQRGKIRMAIKNNEDGYATCRLCKARFTTTPYAMEYVKKCIHKVQEIVNQMKFICIACNMGQDTQKYLEQLAILLSVLKKTYKKMLKVALKRDKIKNKQNSSKRRKNKEDAQTFGHWK